MAQWMRLQSDGSPPKMTFRIDLPPGELRDLSPNINYLATLLEVLLPDQLAGIVSIATTVSGAQLEFKGAGEWTGLTYDSDIVPRWMFAEVAFRELLNQRVQDFIEVLEQMQPCTATESGHLGWSEAWTAG